MAPFALSPRIPCAPLVALIALFFCGCGNREDRTINFSPDGKQVAFQHGDDGVFIRDTASNTMERIYDLKEDEITASTPLWSPDGAQVIFTTATPTDDNEFTEPIVRWDDAPTGRAFSKRPIEYTCWIQDRKQRPFDPPRPLFQSACDDTGYVAANLAVRWHPDGTRIGFIESHHEHSLTLYEFDLRTETTRRVFPYFFKAGAFDWSPDGRYLMCVADCRSDRVADGIWIARAHDTENWKPLAGGKPIEGLTLSLLGDLPRWSPDGNRIAFLRLHNEGDKQPLRHHVFVGNPADHSVKLVADHPGAIDDLAWSPNGIHLGYLHRKPIQRAQSDPDDSLKELRERAEIIVIDVNAGTQVTAAAGNLRKFAGWNATGNRLAYTIASPDFLDSLVDHKSLITRVPSARDTLVVANVNNDFAPNVVCREMRMTFPRWSPQEDKLSLWLTFTPSHQSLTSVSLASGLRAGDPAATIDANTGHIDWMPVHPRETVQIGHWHLMRHEFTQADKRYREARKEFEKQSNSASRDWSRDPQRFEFFEAITAENLNHHDEARESLKTFFRFAERENPRWFDNQTELIAGDRSRLTGLLTHLYAAEVFLSVDAATQGVEFYRGVLSRGVGGSRFFQLGRDAAEDSNLNSTEHRLAATLALSQLLLQDGRFPDYAKLVSQDLSKLIVDLYDEPLTQAFDTTDFNRAPVACSAGFALLPLTENLSKIMLPRSSLKDMARSWEHHLESATSATLKAWFAQLLQATEKALGNEENAVAAGRQFQQFRDDTTLELDRLTIQWEHALILQHVRMAFNDLRP